MKQQYSEKLKGLVNRHQIGRRCIDLKFNATAMEEWVKQLTTTDSKVQGVKEFEWNDTITATQKRANRVNKAQEIKRKKEWAEQRRIRTEQYLERKAERERKDAERKERDEKRKKDREAAKASKDG